MNNGRRASRKKTILFVELNQDGTVGGSHYCLLYLIKVLDRKKYKPIVMFYEQSRIINEFTKAGCDTVVYEKPLGIRFDPPSAVLNIPYMIMRKGYNYTRTSFIPLVKFAYFIVRNNVDLVHLNNSASLGWEWLVACKLLHRRCITHERGVDPFTRLERKRGKYFDKIICMSKAIEDFLEEIGITNNTITIYDGMNPGEFRKRIRRDILEVKKEFGIDDSMALIGLVANFQEWKGQLTVIRAVSMLREKYPKLKCLLIGDVSPVDRRDIEYFRRVEEEIEHRNLRKNIIITGYRSDVPDLVNSLDIAIHSSIEPEPFGMVVLEAMCLAKPIIATDMGGPKEIIENGVSGILIPPEDPGILAKNIERLLENPNERKKIAENALRRVLEKFNVETFSLQIHTLYDELLAS